MTSEFTMRCIPEVFLLPVGPAGLLRAGADAPPPGVEKKQVKEPPKQLPKSTEKFKGLQDCKLDGNFFIKMFGIHNFNLLTHHTQPVTNEFT